MTKHELMAHNFEKFSIVERRDAIFEFEKFLLSIPKEHHIEMPPVHHFSKGMYAREITIPRGTILTGAIHLTEHLCVVSKGDITIFSEFGVKRIKAPATFNSQPGVKRLGFANEDTVFTTFHVTEETDPEKIVSDITVNDYAEFERLMEKRLCQL